MKRFSPPLGELRETLATVISVKVETYDLAEACEELGLRAGDNEEASRSTFKYVHQRIKNFSRDEIVDLANVALTRWDSFELRECLRRFLRENQPRITMVTRQRLQEELNNLPPLPGKLAAVDFLRHLVPIDDLPSFDLRFMTFSEEILQHTERNDDWDNAYILNRIGFMTASDELLCELAELLVHPTVREGDEQSEFVAALNRILGVDGYTMEEVDNISGVPVFGVRRPEGGVKGRPKNLIFASTGPKPEILLADAVNNDITIVRNAEFILVYDRVISREGLTWTDLVSWWKAQPGVVPNTAERSLFLRLRDSAASPPERWFLQAYYTVFKDRMGTWPALIPQVYLHYDPKTIRELAGKKRFIHQRMDFLLLLPNGVRVVIEIDGTHHYADAGGVACPSRYAQMVKEDRILRLRGYEVYRFGGKELSSAAATEELTRTFFELLMDRHKISLSRTTSS